MMFWKKNNINQQPKRLLIMGLFDFIFRSKKNRSSEVTSMSESEESLDTSDLVKIRVMDDSNIKTIICLEDDDIMEFHDLEFRAMREGKEFFLYSKDKWEKALAEREKLNLLDQLMFSTARLNNKGIELEKAGDIQSAIKVYEENVKLYEDNVDIGFLARHQYDRLIILYHKLKDYENEKRILNKAVVLFPDDTGYKKKLAVLNGSFEEKAITSAPKEIERTDNWGEIWEKRILEVPEFDFYFEQETNPNKYSYSFTETERIFSSVWEVQKHFKTIEHEAKAAEDLGELEQAVKLYEQMVAERYYMPSPYDRLIKIYSKAKLHEEEIRILKIGIDHFKQLREKRLAYVMYLAHKYHAVEFAQERINNGKKITYYNGLFELYNPFPIVEKWELRLQKLLDKLNK